MSNVATTFQSCRKPAMRPPVLSVAQLSGVLQRKCACGSPAASLTGECEQCKSKGRLQTKLIIGASNDSLELEADRVADQVMQAPNPGSTVATALPRISGKCATCGEEEAKKLQTTATTTAGTVAGEAPASVDEALRSPGQPLDPATRTFFEPRFGHDFSAVRVHADAKSAESARKANALAYTVGQDIAFAEGRYAPQTLEGRRLIAHELTHTIQQDRQTGPVSRCPSAILQRQDDQENGDLPPAGAPTNDQTQATSANVEGQNRDSEIETSGQGPTTPPSTPAVPPTPEITLETGNVGAGSINNAVHQQICADAGSGTGKQCFSFGALEGLAKFQMPQFSSTWLGWDSLVVGAILKGEVYNPYPVPGATIVSRHTPTAPQVGNWVAYMRGTRLGLQDAYSVARHNCRLFSQWEFRDAPSHW
jgi:hypothetical protein